MPADSAPRSQQAVGAVAMVLGGLTCQEVGAAIAVLLFPAAGPTGMTFLRLAFSALLLLAILRPRLRGHTSQGWVTVVGFGVVLAAMNLCFYEALARLPLGAAVTIEVLGPLVLSVVTSRRAIAWLWALLASAGVALLGWGSLTALDPVGVGFALAAGALWAGYIVGSARTGAAFPRFDGLAIAMSVGALVSLPFALLGTGAGILRPDILGLGLAVAVLSSMIPYGLELIALRRIRPATFAILMSLAPAIAALTGQVVLAQELTPLQWLAIGLVVAASAGAVRTGEPRGGAPGGAAEAGTASPVLPG
ncbi:DMT family transporter [Lysobacter korlensis]|uniref:DMT family transporter n=1 Tax=Lysobacter korlensis TaxID=553636 RepID=A0ABV6RXW3_9GAMM